MAGISWLDTGCWMLDAELGRRSHAFLKSRPFSMPAKVKRPLTADERERFRQNAQHYVEAARIYKDDR